MSDLTVDAVEPISFAMRVFAQPLSASSRTLIRRSARAFSAALTFDDFADFVDLADVFLPPEAFLLRALLRQQT